MKGDGRRVAQRRPDILAAEYQLKAANASIGAARAAFFPSITLSGAGGLSSVGLGQRINPASFTWNFVPRINLPIFRGGPFKASLDVAEISKSIEVAKYERAIQAAFREVADALVARDEALEKQLEAQGKRVAAEEERYRLAELRYRAGNERDVTQLTAQRDLYTAQQQLIDAQVSQLAKRCLPLPGARRRVAGAHLGPLSGGERARVRGVPQCLPKTQPLRHGCVKSSPIVGKDGGAPSPERNDVSGARPNLCATHPQAP
ncbi:TolC family protein [Stigmatella sp. ncwal1]|uniref:TolC family protein n=1 Tax=Stigmatella ashevillensis TaxID=2995309 RepID=A0ABT5D1I5_9BACT|nr:TolC family protein [Stigmatella ashevillena]MDC0707532.1 TolC family protein [Stigmatella ashevillena]